jgi:hypothetical protein
MERNMKRINPRKAGIGWVSPGLVALSGILFILYMVSTFGFPEPYIHDEFAYLLGADTFLEGRLTNPTPPMPEFFETFHVNLTPTYHSKYPPGQSAFLALGKLLFGKEIYGVWLSFVLAAVAVTWALQAVFPPPWALLAGLLATLNATFLMRWGFSFWGGSVAMLGGALYMGGMLRLVRRPGWPAAFWVSAGLGVLAFTRPFEGLLTAGIPLLFYVDHEWRKRSTPGRWRKSCQAVGLLAGMGLLILLANLAYNHALTGSALTFPHSQWNPGQSAHALVRAYQGSKPFSLGAKADRYFHVFLGPVLWIFPLIALRSVRDRRILAGFVTVLLVAGVVLYTSRAWPHYFAPAVPMVIGLMVAGGLQLSRWRLGRTRIGLLFAGTALVIHFGLQLNDVSTRGPKTIHFKGARERGMVYKRDIDRYLEGRPGNHLILVRYLDGHSLHRDYVYNRANLPGARVIWAREMTEEQNQKLFRTYPDRQVWLLPIRLRPLELVSLGTTENQIPVR